MLRLHSLEHTGCGLLARPALPRVKSWLLSAIHILDDGADSP